MNESSQLQMLLAQHSVLYGKRINLRPVTLNDASALFEYASDPTTTQFIFETHPSLAKTRESIANFFIGDPLGKFAIEHIDSQKMIGTIDLRVDGQHQRAELGYALNKAYQGHGYMTEAGQLLLELAFSTLGLNKVESHCDINNPASAAVMKRLGLQYEGTLRQHKWFKGKFCDYAFYGLLKSEYQKNSVVQSKEKPIE